VSTIDKNKNNILFIIDPQNDFHPGGTLGVPGANEDSARIADFIRNNIDAIDEIYVSLDSHHRIHIAHGVFWKNNAGEHPPPFTLIQSEDVTAGTWTPVDDSKREYALEYTRALEEKGRFVVCIWPEHCLIGTKGHAVVPVLNEALQEWVCSTMKPVEYINKGMNCLTEMYSAIAAEVPLPEDPSTNTNHQLIERLHKADKLFFCGEAKSHCVNYTMRDIASHWKKDHSALVLLNDCTSTVPGFESAADTFEQEMRALGCQITTT
jgi:nicotinamidase/pyrazinamidase